MKLTLEPSDGGRVEVDDGEVGTRWIDHKILLSVDDGTTGVSLLLSPLEARVFSRTLMEAAS